MIAVPPPKPEAAITPTVGSAILTIIEPEDHVPPVEPSNRVTDASSHITPVPVISVGDGLTVTIAVVAPPLVVYVIVDVPGIEPVTFPDVEFIVAIPVLLLDHVPPDVPSERGLTTPAHRLKLPVIIGGVCPKEINESNNAINVRLRCFILSILF